MQPDTSRLLSPLIQASRHGVFLRGGGEARYSRPVLGLYQSSSIKYFGAAPTHSHPPKAGLRQESLSRWRRWMLEKAVRHGQRKNPPSFLPSSTALELRLDKNRRSSPAKSFAISDMARNRFRQGLPPGYDPGSDGQGFLRTLTRKEDSSSRVQCTILDHQGTVQGTDIVSKSELCTRYHIQPRDLRRVDARVTNMVPSILIRPGTILVNALHVRSLIRPDCCLLFESAAVFPDGALAAHSAFLFNLSNALRRTDASRGCHTETQAGSAPYEFRALEAMLNSVSSTLESELGILRTLVTELLESLEHNIDRDRLTQLLHYSRRLAAFNRRAELCLECLDELLENDDDMANAYLSEAAAGRPRQQDDHEEFEQMIESFSIHTEEIVTEGQSLSSRIEQLERVVELMLDSNRNALLGLDLQVSIWTAALGAGALVAGCFGMNLSTGYESHPYAFATTAGAVLLVVAGATASGLRTLQKLRRVGLGKSTSWVSEPHRSFGKWLANTPRAS